MSAALYIHVLLDIPTLSAALYIHVLLDIPAFSAALCRGYNYDNLYEDDYCLALQNKLWTTFNIDMLNMDYIHRDTRYVVKCGVFCVLYLYFRIKYNRGLLVLF